jgi:hypothetical protein
MARIHYNFGAMKRTPMTVKASHERPHVAPLFIRVTQILDALKHSVVSGRALPTPTFNNDRGGIAAPL